MITPNRNKVAQKLHQLIAGEVIAENAQLRRFARDQSIYEILPLVVVVPKSLADLEQVLRFASETGIPVTPRGGGSGTAGSALGQGIVIALQGGGFLNQITAFSSLAQHASVTAEAGVIHEHLQRYLRARGFFLPADPSSAPICRLGGNIATKASGPHALKHGSIDRFVEHLTFFTANGDVVNTADETTIPSSLSRQLRALEHQVLEDTEACTTLARRQSMKIASGYNLFAFLRHLPLGALVAQLLVGSVGTLGFITSATLRGEPYHAARAAMLVYFTNLAQAGEAACAIRDLGVAAIEIINQETIRVIKARSPSFAPDAHMVLIECDGPERFDQIDRLQALFATQRFTLAAPPAIATNAEEIETLWTVRKQILPIIRNYSPHLKALSVVNDVGVPPERLAALIDDLQRLFRTQQIVTMIYGHAGSGNLHLRPLFDVSQPDLPARIQRIADAVYELVLHHQGTITAEHGMGRLRTPYLKTEWGPRLFTYMQTLKQIFDPDGVFNPDVMFSERPITDHLRQTF